MMMIVGKKVEELIARLAQKAARVPYDSRTQRRQWMSSRAYQGEGATRIAFQVSQGSICGHSRSAG